MVPPTPIQQATAIQQDRATDRRGERGWLRLFTPILVLLVRLWLSTLRVRVVDLTGLPREDPRPWVLAFFHGTQMPLLAWPKRRRTSVLVSWSADGALLAALLGALGFHVVRGSSSRGGVTGLLGLMRPLLRQQTDVAIAVDGPRGPRGTVHPGALACARRSAGQVVPMGAAVSRARVMHRSWDHFVLPMPFSRAVVVLGPPLAAETTALRLGEAIRAANHRAELELETLELDGPHQKVV